MLTEENGVLREKIILEITEESVIRDYGRLRDTIRKHRERGYRVAIDDFGTGNNGLKMLSIVEPDYVKIDRYFITNVDKEAVNHKIVESIVSACEKMGVKVIAEGIERQEELEVLEGVGVKIVQGYYLGKPSLFTPFLSLSKHLC